MSNDLIFENVVYFPKTYGAIQINAVNKLISKTNKEFSLDAHIDPVSAIYELKRLGLDIEFQDSLFLSSRLNS